MRSVKGRKSERERENRRETKAIRENARRGTTVNKERTRRCNMGGSNREKQALGKVFHA